MKLTRIIAWRYGGFGVVEFLPAQPGHKVFWSTGVGKALAIGPGWLLPSAPRKLAWITDPPTAKLARFFARRAVAEDQGLPPYTYTDRNTDPVCPSPSPTPS
jgi:hypothetical protein